MPLSNLTHKTYEKNNHPNTHRITYNSHDTQRMQHRQDTCHTDRE